MIWTRIFGLEVLEKADFISLLNVNGKKICAVKRGREIFAVQSRCPHAGADLSQGWCSENMLVCPFHRFSYDLYTGKGATGQNDYISTYPVEIREDGVFIGVRRAWWPFK